MSPFDGNNCFVLVLCCDGGFTSVLGVSPVFFGTKYTGEPQCNVFTKNKTKKQQE